MKILVVDDHSLFREGLHLLLARLGSEIEIFDAGSADAGLAFASQCGDIDLILLDVNLPGLRGLDSLRLFRQSFPDSRIVLLSGVDASPLIREALAKGAQGFIHKSVTADEMLTAIRSVLDGGSCCAMSQNSLGTTAMDPLTSMPRPTSLTPRQMEVLAMLCDGMSNKEIGRELSMSGNTVRVHLVGIFRALGARSRTEAAMIARRCGLIA